jgi:hypothetical protein
MIGVFGSDRTDHRQTRLFRIVREANGAYTDGQAGFSFLLALLVNLNAQFDFRNKMPLFCSPGMRCRSLHIWHNLQYLQNS